MYISKTLIIYSYFILILWAFNKHLCKDNIQFKVY